MLNLSQLEPWTQDALAAVWRGARLKGVTALKGDASSQRFWRVFIEARKRRVPKTAIAVELGPEDLPLYARALKLFTEPLAEPPFTDVHRFLSSIGAAVPEIYYAPAGDRRLLVEDVGDRSLLKTARRLPDTVDDLYRLAVEQLLLIHVKGTRRLDQRCIASRIAYDERLFRWELEHFVEFGLDAVAPGADAAAISPELDELAAHLGSIPRVFSHRDYHGENLFIQDSGRLRVIDFQDALLAPAAQDLAVLLTTRDTATLIRPRTEQRLLEYYMAGRLRAQMPGPGTEQFLESYRLCVLQHALKAIGRFVWLGRGGKPGYAAYIPHALAQARRMLEQRGDFPRLRAALQA